MTNRPYARVYYDQLEQEFPEVWQDATLGWTWLRLLVVAEKMWPTVPEVPRSLRQKSVLRLMELGLVIPVPPHGFRIRGLDAERTRRSNAARSAARNRWGNAGHEMPSRDEDQDEIPPTPRRAGGSRRDGTNPRAVAAREREAARERAHKNRLEATQRRIQELRPAS